MIGYFDMSGYKRRKKNTRSPRKVYVIVCEGKKTERIYFKKYRTRYSNISIKTPDSKYTDPENLTRFANSKEAKPDLTPARDF
ncbi:MAG: RloB domain-containing protein [Methanosarcinales archaeon]|nr:MAG: RloB domain-containing protein [Methanosarcinales archaeon]